MHLRNLIFIEKVILQNSESMTSFLLVAARTQQKTTHIHRSWEILGVSWRILISKSAVFAMSSLFFVVTAIFWARGQRDAEDLRPLLLHGKCREAVGLPGMLGDTFSLGGFPDAFPLFFGEGWQVWFLRYRFLLYCIHRSPLFATIWPSHVHLQIHGLHENCLSGFYNVYNQPVDFYAAQKVSWTNPGFPFTAKLAKLVHITSITVGSIEGVTYSSWGF